MDASTNSATLLSSSVRSAHNARPQTPRGSPTLGGSTDGIPTGSVRLGRSASLGEMRRSSSATARHAALSRTPQQPNTEQKHQSAVGSGTPAFQTIEAMGSSSFAQPRPPIVVAMGSINKGNGFSIQSSQNQTQWGATARNHHRGLQHPALPTSAITTFLQSPAAKMLGWAMDAGIDLLPPAEMLALRSDVLEQPTSGQAIGKLAEACEKHAAHLQRMYMSHLCLNCDQNNGGGSGGRRRRGAAHTLSMKGSDNDGEDFSEVPRFLLNTTTMSGGNALTYNQLQRKRAKDEAKAHRRQQLEQRRAVEGLMRAHEAAQRRAGKLLRKAQREAARQEAIRQQEVAERKVSAAGASSSSYPADDNKTPLKKFKYDYEEEEEFDKKSSGGYNSAASACDDDDAQKEEGVDESGKNDVSSSAKAPPTTTTNKEELFAEVFTSEDDDDENAAAYPDDLLGSSLNDDDTNPQEHQQPPPPPSLRHYRQQLQRAELALHAIHKYVEQGPSYLGQLYKHAVGHGDGGITTPSGRNNQQPPRFQGSNTRPSSAHSRDKPTRASLLRSIAASAATGLPPAHLNQQHAAAGGGSSASTHHLLRPQQQQQYTFQFAHLTGAYQMPTYGSLEGAKKAAEDSKKLRRVVDKLAMLENGSKPKRQSGEGDGDEEGAADGEGGEGEEEYGGGGGDDEEGPTIDVKFLEQTGSLQVKLRLTEAQLIAIRSQISVPKVVGPDGKEEDAELALSSSTFLFQSEFIGLSEDLWLGARGPWRGKLLHVCRREARQQQQGPHLHQTQSHSSQGLAAPAYLETLSKLLDGRNGHFPDNNGSDGNTITNVRPSGSQPIDSIIIGQWCFVKKELGASSGGEGGGGIVANSSPNDPYQCIGCGNIRHSGNMCYADPSVASGMRRGKYYCPFCRRSMVHVNVALAMMGGGGPRVPQTWNGGPKYRGHGF